MLSILIVNWNTKDLLRLCLRSISAFPPTREYEVIVVDNASKDGSAEMVSLEFPDARLIASDKNTGYARGNNMAFQQAKGDLLLTLNPDTEFIDQSLDGAVRILEANSTAGCLGIRQIGLDGLTQRSVRGFPSLMGIFGDVTGLGKHFGGVLDSYRLSRFDYEKEQIAPQPMGTFTLFSKSSPRRGRICDSAVRRALSYLL